MEVVVVVVVVVAAAMKCVGVLGLVLVWSFVRFIYGEGGRELNVEMMGGSQRGGVKDIIS